MVIEHETIQPLYQESSVNIHIKQKDIVKFSFTRTPIENVITMVITIVIIHLFVTIIIISVVAP